MPQLHGEPFNSVWKWENIVQTNFIGFSLDGLEKLAVALKFRLFEFLVA